MKAIVFLALLGLLLAAIGPLIRVRTVTTMRWDDFYAMAEEENIDILILGSSQSFRGIDPRILEDSLGMSAYNLSQSAQVITQTRYALEEALRFTTPKIVVLEAYFLNQTELIEDRWYFAYEEVAAMRTGLPKYKYIFRLFTPMTYLDALFPALREHDNWSDEETLEANAVYRETGFSPEKDNLHLGYVEDASVLGEENLLQYAELAYHEQDFTMTPAADRQIDAIHRMLEERGIRLILVKTAMPAAHTEKTNEADRHAMAQSVADRLGIPFIDYNTLYHDLGFDNTCFRDEFSLTNHHLNTTGARITTLYLAEAINALAPEQ